MIRITKRLFSFRTLPTPNANALKFLSPEVMILPVNRTFEFTTLSQAQRSPLADKLFRVPGVSSVMLGRDFLTVNKQDYINWANLRPDIIDVVDAFMIKAELPTVNQDMIDEAREEAALSSEGDSEVVSMIKELMETRIRPAVQDDGGDIEFMGFNEETGIVLLKLQGACKSCSLSGDTLKNGIESMMMHYIEEVSGVEQVLDVGEEVALKEFARMEEMLEAKRLNNHDSPPVL